jgi:hypothetical protein
VRDGHGNVEEPEVTMAMMDNKGMTEDEAIRFTK